MCSRRQLSMCMSHSPRRIPCYASSSACRHRSDGLLVLLSVSPSVPRWALPSVRQSVLPSVLPSVRLWVMPWVMLSAMALLRTSVAARATDRMLRA